MTLLNGLTRIHVIGAGGIGLSAAAKLLRRFGHSVTGSDLRPNEATAELERLGVPVAFPQRAENVPDGAEAVVFSDAVPPENPERAEARRRGLREMSYFDLLGELSRERRTVAVSGTNGKSTTTAMLGLLLQEAGLDPTVIVGSRLADFPDGNLRLGRSGLLAVEACEYRANMLKLSPQAIVLTNIEADHLDFYRDLDHIKETFQAYLDRLPAGGLAILNADDRNISDLKRPKGSITYGFGEKADYRAADWETGAGEQSFRLLAKGRDFGRFTLRVPGRYNAMNALAALSAALELGGDPESLRRTLAAFPGIWRRFERLGEFGGAEIVSDYGHTPTAIRGVVRAAREFFPGRRVLLCFQPHHRNRTKSLFGDFAEVLADPDELILVEIFDVAGREEAADAAVSSRDLLAAVGSVGGKGAGAYVPDLAAAESLLREKIMPGDVAIVMGAGDIYLIAERLSGRRP